MNNDTGANYIVQNLNFLLEEPTGSPTLLAATFTNEDTGVVTDLKLNGGITLL
jgi:hypothetical protein